MVKNGWKETVISCEMLPKDSQSLSFVLVHVWKMKEKADTSQAMLDEHENPIKKGKSKKSSSIYLDKAVSDEEKLKIDKMFEAKKHAMLPTKSIKKIKTELNCTDQKQDAVCDETSKSAYHAVQYLTLWKNDRSNWKFKKTRQVWLLQNMYCKEKVLYVLDALYWNACHVKMLWKLFVFLYM